MQEINYKYITPQLKEMLIEDRRDFHRHPEEGWLEYRTSWLVAKRLKELNYDVKIGKEVCDAQSRMGVPSKQILDSCEKRALKEGVSKEHIEKIAGGFTGVVGIIKGNSGSKVTVLRFDMDALPMQEENDANYSSVYPGVMHGCGHDGHVAVGLAVAKLLAEHKDKIDGEVRLIFQPAEEGCRGAVSIVKSGWLDNVDVFLSGHLGISCFKLGDIGAVFDGFLATTKMNITIKGKSSHAGKAPEDGNNALLAAAVFTTNAYSISRTSIGDTRINIGKLISGNSSNIIADNAYMEIETRGSTTEANQYMEAAVMDILKGIEQMYHVSCEVEIVGRVGSAKSSKALVNQLREKLEQMNLIDSFRDDAYMGASEDVVEMMSYVEYNGGKAAYYLFGTELNAQHHQNTFDFQEEVLSIMTEFYARSILVDKYSLIKAKEVHIDGIVSLYERVIEAVNKSKVKLGWNINIYPDRRFVEEAVERGECYIYEGNNKILAVSVLNDRVNEEYKLVPWEITEELPYSVATIHALCTDPDMRGSNFAFTYLKNIQDKAKELGYKAIHLDVIDTNIPAYKLYEKAGFKMIKEIEMYYEVVGTRHFWMFEKIL